MSSNSNDFPCFHCHKTMAHWNAYLLTRVPEGEDYTMLLCDNCSNQLVAEFKMIRDKDKEFEEYERELRKVDWNRIWKHEQERWEEEK